jgi:hypothetical protein
MSSAESASADAAGRPAMGAGLSAYGTLAVSTCVCMCVYGTCVCVYGTQAVSALDHAWRCLVLAEFRDRAFECGPQGSAGMEVRKPERTKTSAPSSARAKIRTVGKTAGWTAPHRKKEGKKDLRPLPGVR